MRYVIEGEWGGYVSSQQRVVHRRVTTRKDIVEWAQKVRAIRFTDGTSLYVTVRQCKPREKVKEIRGYDTLLFECRMYKVDSVDALCKAQANRAGGSSSGGKAQCSAVPSGSTPPPATISH